MRVRAELVSNIPHGGRVYVDRGRGESTVVWLDKGTFTAREAAIVDQALQDDPSLLLNLETIAA